MTELLEPVEEQRRLTEFVWHLQRILQAVVDRPYGIVPGRHHELLRAAWLEVTPSFEQLRPAVIQPDPVTSQRLGELGLVGYRLQFELAIFDQARAQLFDHAPEIFVPGPLVSIEPRPQARKPGFFKRLGGLVRRCFKAGDVVLGSLTVLFPPAETISQFKEGIEEAVTLARGEREP